MSLGCPCFKKSLQCSLKNCGHDVVYQHTANKQHFQLSTGGQQETSAFTVNVSPLLSSNRLQLSMLISFRAVRFALCDHNRCMTHITILQSQVGTL